MGSKVIHFFAIVVFLIRYLAQTEVQETCSVEGNRGRRVTVNIETIEDDDGEWMTSFIAQKNSSTLAKKLNLVVGHEIFDCNGKQIVRVRGYVKDVFKDAPLGVTDVELLFDRRASENAIIKNNGLTIEKKNPNGYASALTNRALKDNELLEVVVTRRKESPDYAMAMGVNLNPPFLIKVPDHMNSITNGSWMLYYHNLFHNASVVNSNYLPSNLNVQIGGRVGVMRKSSGDLHFYLDGVDKGPAASNIPMQVYGAVELWGAALEATIVKPV